MAARFLKVRFPYLKLLSFETMWLRLMAATTPYILTLPTKISQKAFRNNINNKSPGNHAGAKPKKSII